jgi:hypothetical protein
MAPDGQFIDFHLARMRRDPPVQLVWLVLRLLGKPFLTGGHQA